MSVAEITAHLLQLSVEDRAEITGQLLDSLDAADPNDFDSDSLTEAIRRSEELKQGIVQPITEEELWRSVNEFRGR